MSTQSGIQSFADEAQESNSEQLEHSIEANLLEQNIDPKMLKLEGEPEDLSSAREDLIKTLKGLEGGEVMFEVEDTSSMSQEGDHLQSEFTGRTETIQISKTRMSCSKNMTIWK